MKPSKSPTSEATITRFGLPFEKPRFAPEPCLGCQYPRECYHNDDCPKDTRADQDERRQTLENARLHSRKRGNGSVTPSSLGGTFEWRDVCERCHDVIEMPLDGTPPKHLCLTDPEVAALVKALRDLAHAAEDLNRDDTSDSVDEEPIKAARQLLEVGPSYEEP